MVGPRVEIVPPLVIVLPLTIAPPILTVLPMVGIVHPMEIARLTGIVRVEIVPTAAEAVSVPVPKVAVIPPVMAVRNVQVEIVPGLRVDLRVPVATAVVVRVVVRVALVVPGNRPVRVRVAQEAQVAGKPGIRRPPARSGLLRGSRRTMGMRIAESKP